MKTIRFTAALLCAFALASCDEMRPFNPNPDQGLFSLSDVAKMLSDLPLESGHLDEVYDAVTSSSGHGYDEEYRLTDLFEAPGAGVGDSPQTRATKAGGYPVPLRELFANYLSDKYGTKPYTEYPWYTQPMTTGKTCWTDPLPNEEDEGVTLSFCKPITDGKQQLVGVVVADVSVRQLSDIVLSAQSTSDNYTVLLGSNGSFIVHPDQLNLLNETVFTQPEKSENSSIQEAAKAMLNGETGYLPFEQNGEDWYVFYKPFQQAKTPNRSMERINWSIGVVYSEAAAFGHYNHLLMLVVVIAVAGLLLLWLLCRLVIHRQLKSLRQLTHVTQRIAEGHYDDPMPDIRRNDEIGQLYDHLKEMSKSLAAHVKELNLLTGQLKNRREVMYEVYAKERSVDRVMSSFLHFVTNQMIAPAQDVKRYVEKLCTSYRSFAPEEVGHIVSTINRKSDSIIELINNTLDTADSHHLGDSEAGKEADHD